MTVPLFEPPHRPMPEHQAISAYKEALPEGEVLAYPLDPLDHLGLPVWSAELISTEGTLHHGAGFGGSDERAVVGAFGEMAETLFAGRAMKRLKPRRASYRDLVRELGPDGVLDPLTVCLTVGSDYTLEKPLRWIEARRWGTDEAVLVPIELAAASSVDIEPEGDGWLVLPVTNGLGAGPSVEHAMAHGLLELVQRDGNSATYRALDLGVGVRLDDVRDPETRALLDKIDRAGIDVTVKLASTDFGIANLYVVGAERDPEKAPHPLALTACGEAADPDREKALKKALMEYVAGRSRKLFDNGPLSRMAAVAPGAYVGRAIRAATLEHEEERSLRESLAWLRLDAPEMRGLLEDPVFTVRSRVDFSSLPEAPNEKAGSSADSVVGRLRADGLDPLYVDLSPPGGGVRVAKAIVPGLEVETASYARIGARNLRRMLRRGDGLVGTTNPPSGAKRILLPETEEFGPEPWLDVGALDAKVGRLYPLYREPSRHVTALVADGVL